MFSMNCRERKQIEKGKQIFEEIMAKKFLELKKDTNPQVERVQMN